MMCDEQWSEWIEWDGSENCPVGNAVEHQVWLHNGYKSQSHFDNTEKFGWSAVKAYRYKLSIGEQLIDAPQEEVTIERPYDAYTTDELVHAVRGMREEIKRRCLR